MEVTPDGIISIARAPTDPQFDIVFGGRYWQIEEAGEPIVRSPSLDTVRLELPKDFTPSEVEQSAYVVGPENQNLYAVIRNHLLPGKDNNERRVLTITTAVDAAEIEEDTNKFATDLFRGLTGLAAILMLGAWIHVTIGLRPLETLRSRVADVREGKADQIIGDYPDEVMPLVLETNALLDAQDKALTAARERAGNLAHGLNTPLAIMTAKSRELRAKGEHDVAKDIDEQIENMRRHVERELARTRARGPSGSGQAPIDAVALLRGIIQAIDSLPRNIPIDWADDFPEKFPLTADRDDFNNIFGNLLENAHKWAKTKVQISVRNCSNGAEFIIEDDGPGVPEHQVNHVLKRGARADTAIGGSGLGLAIVADLVELYRGSLALSRSELGGLKITILLPQ
jgi:signal transduction histidine kinase